MDIKHMNVDQRLVRHKLHLYLKVIATHVKSMVTRNKIVDLMQNIVENLKVKKMQLGKEML